MGEKFEWKEGAAAVLLCARCKEPVQTGDNHECKELKNEDSNTQQTEDESRG
jgi:hypothetical protein